MIHLVLASLLAVAMVCWGLWYIIRKAERLPVGSMEFWMTQALEKDLEVQRLRVELAMQSEMAAKARHALQQYTKLCQERHCKP